MLFTTIKDIQALLYLLAAFMIYSRKYPKGPVLAMALLLFDLMLEANAFALSDLYDKYTSEMMTLKLLPAISGCLLLLTHGRVKGSHDSSIKINPFSSRGRYTRGELKSN